MTQTTGHSLIRHQDIGTSFDGVYYVESIFIKQTVQKKDYSDVILRDRSGSRNVKFWGVVQDVAKGDYVYVSAVVEDYLGSPSVIAKNMEKADVPDDMYDYIPIYDDLENSAERFDVLRKELKELEEKTGDKTAGMMVDEVYGNGAFFDKFLVAPGSSKPHYGRQGGLFANVVRVAEASMTMAGSYGLSENEKVVLLASAFLSRIGLIDAFEFKDCMPVITKRGILLGVNNLTMTRVSSALKRVTSALSKEGKSPDQDVVLRVLHAVSSCDSHSVLPMTKEAMVLSAAFRTDSEMVDATDFISNDTNLSEEFTAYDPAKGRKYYTGVRAV